MYKWLPDALSNDSQVVTANRRLARVLAAQYGGSQLAAGRSSWPTPTVAGWSDWLSALLDAVTIDTDLPIRLSSQQCQVLWERSIRQELREPPSNINGLVRLASEAWSRLHEWNVPFEECRKSAFGADQRLFAGAATRYRIALESNGWTDDAGRTALIRDLVRAKKLELPARICMAGFDRIVPATKSLLDEIEAQGVQVNIHSVREPAADISMTGFENPDAELRAAGAWAREQLQRDPGASVAIVAGNLDQEAERTRRLVLEGLVPGWQLGDARHSGALNVSYGRKLREFPAVTIALLALRWLIDEFSARDISLLLRSTAIGKPATSGRSRLELRLRELPDRNWSPELLLRALSARDEDEDAVDFLRRVRQVAGHRGSKPQEASPSKWAEWIDEYLRCLNWPGETPLDSFEFQLVNRWRELLNDFARLELVSPKMTFAAAFGRLCGLASDTVFQPEAEGAVVQLLGPLEAAGMEFDRLWISGLSANSWPPTGRPSPFLARKLQRQYGMPDAEPSDTANYARRVLTRLASSAEKVAGSFPRTEGDAEQTPATLLGQLAASPEGQLQDVAWHASSLLNCRKLQPVEDRVPRVASDEIVAGGAATIQKQLSNPFAAFAAGRLGIRYMPTIASGLAANLRGNLIHDALHALYKSEPTQAEIAAWVANDLGSRIAAAVDHAFSRHERHADSVLRRLFALERLRVQRLLARVVELDVDREEFAIHAVEGQCDAEINGVRLSLRYDRIDRLPDGDLAILDYKTGVFKKFLQSDGHPRDFQLVVYACTLPRDVAGLGLVNIDSRGVVFDGAGEPFGDTSDWHRHLGGWKAEVRNAADVISRGDVRVNARLNLKDARPLALLSRFAELRRDI
jgi:probable DNA repair protein